MRKWPGDLQKSLDFEVLKSQACSLRPFLDRGSAFLSLVEAHSTRNLRLQALGFETSESKFLCRAPATSASRNNSLSRKVLIIRGWDSFRKA